MMAKGGDGGKWIFENGLPGGASHFLATAQTRRVLPLVAQVSKPAVPQTSKSASRQQVWKPAARQVWKPALQKMRCAPCRAIPPIFRAKAELRTALQDASRLSRNDAVGIQRKDAKAQRRKGRKRKRLLDQRSPFGGLDLQAQLLFASWRPTRSVFP
jgi:hypothetical protein